MADAPVTPPPAPAPKVLVYDMDAARPGEVTPEQAKANPQRFQPIGDQPTRMVDADGNVHELPASEALKATAPEYGYSFLPDEQAAFEGRVQHHLASINNAFDVGAREFANQLSFGVSGTAEEHTASPEELEAIRRANAEHRAAQVVGGVTGAGLGIAATEGLGELAGAGRAVEGGSDLLHGAQAADATMGGVRTANTVDAARAMATAERVAPEATGALADRAAVQGSEAGAHAAALAMETQSPGLLARLAASTGKGMLQGGAYATPQALAQAYYGDPDHAAESLMWGIGTGGILGLGGASASELLATGANKLKAPLAAKAIEEGLLHPDGTWDKDLLLKTAAENDAKRMGISGSDWNRMSKAAQEDMLNELQANPDLTQMSHEELLTLRQKVGENIGEHAEILDKAVAKAPEELKQTIGVKAEDLATQVQDSLLGTMKGLATPMQSEGANFLQKKLLPTIMTFAKSDGAPMSFEELQQLKNLMSKESQGFAKKPPAFYTTKENIITQARDVISQAQSDAMDAAYKALPLNNGHADWLATKTKYGVLKDLERMGPQASDQYGTQMIQSSKQAYGNIPATSTLGKLGGGIGEAVGRGALGGAVGAVAGPWPGYIASSVGGHLGRGLLGPILTRHAFDWSQSALRAAAGGEFQWLGAALAKDASAQAIQKTLRIPTLLADRAAVSAAQASAKSDVLKNYLGPKANGLTKDQQLSAVGSALDQAKQQPDHSKQEISALSSLFGFDPRLQSAYASKNSAAIDYLYNAFPRRPGDPPPFSGKDTWKPSPAQKKAFLDSLEVVNDPHSVVTHALRGDLTDAHVRAISTLYPSQKNAIVEQVWKAAYDPRVGRIPEGVKMSLERLTGIPTSPATNYQNVYHQTQPSGGGRHHQGQGAQAAQSWMTPVQRIATK